MQLRGLSLLCPGLRPRGLSNATKGLSKAAKGPVGAARGLSTALMPATKGRGLSNAARGLLCPGGCRMLLGGGRGC